MERWTLENLIDFEQALAVNPSTSASTKTAVAKAVQGKEGAAARRDGFLIWLNAEKRESSGGKDFLFCLATLRALLMIGGFGAGTILVSSLMNRGLGGFNVVIFLAAVIGLQWLVLLGATLAWVFRRNAVHGLTFVQELIGKAARRLAKGDKTGWWERLEDSGKSHRSALLWRLAELAQTFGICFNIGVMGMFASEVMTRNLGFYWETTTDQAMRGTLGEIVRILSLPWASFWPGAVPDAATIDSTRLLAGKNQLPAGPEAWWLFLLAATFVWGLLPRVFLWLQARSASNRALLKLDFQARHHRALWREITGTTRTEVDEKPLDGVLVLDVGGSGLKAESLRPFLLQKLRVHPAAWHSVAVLDPGAERQAEDSLALAPAGVVFLAEGWALSPPRMKALHAQVRAMAGPETPVKFLVVNESGDDPVSPTPEEKIQWEKFVDSLRDPNAEVFCYA